MRQIWIGPGSGARSAEGRAGRRGVERSGRPHRSPARIYLTGRRPQAWEES